MPRRRSPRTALARVLAILGCVVAAGALVSTWASHQLLDQDTYTDRAVDVIRDPAVRDLTAQLLADTVVEQVQLRVVQSALPPQLQHLAGPTKATFQRTAERAADRALRTESFQRLWQAANRAAHAQFTVWLAETRAGADQGVVLEIEPMLVGVAQRAGLPDAAIQAAVGASQASDTQLQLLRPDQFVEGRRVARRANTAAWASTVLAALLLAGSVLVAPRRRRALAEVGVALAVAAGAVLLLIPQVGTQLVNGLGDGGAARPIAEATWNATRPALEHNAWTLLLVGGAIAIFGWLVSLAGPRIPNP